MEETPLSATDKTDCHDKTEILLKVALNTITLTLTMKLSNHLRNCFIYDPLNTDFFFHYHFYQILL